MAQSISGARSRLRLSILTITVTGFRERTNFRAWPTVAVADEHPRSSDRFLSNDSPCRRSGRPDSWRCARGRFDWRRGRRDYRRRYEAGLVLLLGAPSPPLCALLIRLKFSDARSMIYDFAERIFASDAFRFLNGAIGCTHQPCNVDRVRTPEPFCDCL